MYNPVFKRGYMEDYSYCNGTRERDECSCGGDKTKCDFYPEVREKAMKEIIPKFGDWISVEDRLPDDYRQKYIVYVVSDITNTSWVDTLYFFIPTKTWIFDNELGQTFYRVTHWMPLPNAPEK